MTKDTEQQQSAKIGIADFESGKLDKLCTRDIAFAVQIQLNRLTPRMCFANTIDLVTKEEEVAGL